MKEIRTEIDIRASADRVWEVLTDIERYPEWNPFITRASGDLREGGRLRVRIEPPGRKPMHFRPVVQRLEEGRTVSWRGRFLLPGLFTGVHTFELEPGPDGVRLVQSERFSGILVPLIWKVMEPAIRTGFSGMNQELKARAEGRTE
jgi:hypothetical protein